MPFAYIERLSLDPVNAEVVFKGKNGIAMMEGSFTGKIMYIICGYIISLLMSIILLNLVPDRKSILTRAGDRTLPIYLFHVYIVKILKKITLLHEINDFVLLPLLFAVSIILVFLLGSDFFVKSTYYICNPLEFVRQIKGKLIKKKNKNAEA